MTKVFAPAESTGLYFLCFFFVFFLILAGSFRALGECCRLSHVALSRPFSCKLKTWCYNLKQDASAFLKTGLYHSGQTWRLWWVMAGICIHLLEWWRVGRTETNHGDQKDLNWVGHFYKKKKKNTVNLFVFLISTSSIFHDNMSLDTIMFTEMVVWQENISTNQCKNWKFHLQKLEIGTLYRETEALVTGSSYQCVFYIDINGACACLK